MIAGELDLYIEQGCDWERVLTIYKQTGSPVDLTIAEVEMQIRDTAQGRILCRPEIEIIEPKAGKVRVYIDHEQTAKFPAPGGHYKQTARCVYDVYINYSYRRDRIMNGFLYISPEVTKFERD